MTLAQLRHNEQVAQWWGKTYASPRFQAILQMLSDTHPLRFTDDKTRFSNDAAIHRMGMLEGYELCLERLRLAGQYEPEKAAMPPATFEPVSMAEVDLELQ